MKKLLLIDTSRPVTQLGLCLGDSFSSVRSQKSRMAAQEVLPLVQQLLMAANQDLQDLHGIAVITGPGSFTGLRIGIGVAQGLGSALNIPLLSISSLALQAFSAARQTGCVNCLVAEEARVPEVYFAAYKVRADTAYELLGQEQVGTVESLLIQDFGAPNQDQSGVGSAWQNPVLTKSLQEKFSPGSIVDVESRIDDACMLAKLEFERGAATESLVLPNYVKEQLDYS